MKLLLDFLPILLFFATYVVANGRADAAAAFATEHLGFMVSGGVVGPEEAAVVLATVVVIVATLLQIGITLALRRKVDTMLWITFALVAVLGGATIWFHSPTFIKWKPSALYWAMSLAFWAGPVLFGRNLLKAMLGKQLDLPAPVWQRLNWAWVAFFAFAGCLNLWVAYHFSTDAWVRFKAFGLTGLVLVFMLAQGFYVARHLPPEDAKP